MTPPRLIVLVATTALLVACGGSNDHPERGALLDPPAPVGLPIPAAQIDALTAEHGLQQLTGPALCDVKVIELNYATLGARTERTNASGVLLVPTGGAPGSGCATRAAPLVAYARGTDVNKSRALADPRDPETGLLAAFFAAQGYAVVATDYLGYARSSYWFHPYLHADSEATSVLDSVRAARRAAADVGLRLSGQVLLTGYSQGGHSSMAAQRAAESGYGTEFDIVAGAHLAGPYNMAGAMKSPVAVAGYQFFVPMIITGWQKVYGDIYARADEVFKLPFADWIDNLLPAPDASYTSLVTSGKLPGGTPGQARDALMQPDFLEILQHSDTAPIAVAAQKNTLFNWKPKAPVLLCGGAADPTVPLLIHQNPMVANFAANGVTAESADVDPFIQLNFGPGGVAPTDPNSDEYATYYGNYHGTYEPPFCMKAARDLFEKALGAG
ncbi:MAG TPA: lipase family protein [Ottowia sp.]|uniref:lipase family protein n=1 Tax=Ottowia sp. TaxID=1898956 RepID=UPI002B5D52C0|nr:lipase family protein [Ottowia sp.]HMN21853.1 lipase family protein [Ottowia sp.]